MENSLTQLLSQPHDGSLPEISIYFDTQGNQFRFIAHLLEILKIKESSLIFIDGSDQKVSYFSTVELLQKLSTGHHLNFLSSNNFPELGLGIFENGISIDFYTGNEWTPQRLDAFSKLLKSCIKEFNATHLCLDEEQIKFSNDDIKKFDEWIQS